MTAAQDMIRGRSNIVTLTNNSGGALVAGDVCVQDATGDEYVTTTTSAASTLKVFVAAESIASAATGKFYESGYCPLVNVNAAVTRGRFLFTHTVAKQAAENATYGAGAFGKILKSGTTPSAIIYSATAQLSGGAGSDTTAIHNNVASEISAITAKGSPVSGDFLLIEDSADSNKKKSVTIGTLPSSGGGAATFTSAHASPATAVAAGDIWLPSDSFYAERATAAGTASWAPWGPIFPMTPPPAVSGLTWVNQGSSTATETFGGICLYTPAVAADNLRILKKAKSSPYTITLAFLMQEWHAGNQAAGFCWRQSSGGAAGYCVTVSMGYVSTLGNVIALASNKWTAATTWSANYFQQPTQPTGGPIWLKCEDNNTNRIVSWSADGQNWIVIQTIGRTDFITADEVGIFVQSGSATYPISMTLLSWKET